MIVEGIARAIDTPAPEVATLVAQAYTTKYATMDYAPDPHQWDNGGLFAMTPHTVIA